MDAKGKVRRPTTHFPPYQNRPLMLTTPFTISSHQPLRPFTILPSGGAMDERSRLAAEVFRSGHRLPTMSIDEYLKNEFDSGNVITGGGYVQTACVVDLTSLPVADSWRPRPRPFDPPGKQVKTRLPLPRFSRSPLRTTGRVLVGRRTTRSGRRRRTGRDTRTTTQREQATR